MKTIIIVSALCILLSACQKASDTSTTADIQETAQQVGDVMASVDESGGSSGSLASNEQLMQKSIRGTFARFAPNEINENIMAKLILPNANAATCSGAGFGACNASTDTTVRSFAGCTVGAATFSGDVTLTWGSGGAGTNVDCALGSTAGTHITRVPNFTATGLRGATLAVTKTGTIGQRITWDSVAAPNRVFKLSNDGINRKFTAANATVLFNQTTTTTADVTVTGDARTSRVMNGGNLRVLNNLTSVTCDYVPTNVTWAGTTCNCPTSGSWAGSCSDGKTTTLAITGCGTANYTEGTATQAVTFDRCGT